MPLQAQEEVWADTGQVKLAWDLALPVDQLVADVQVMEGEQLMSPFESDWIGLLSGRVTGAQVIQSNTMGGSSGILFRGHRYGETGNGPLVVVDGFPIDNRDFSAGQQGFGGYAYGQLSQDIQAGDIQQLVFLKSPAASFLYGSKGVNGVVQVITKDAAAGKGLRVSLNSSYMIMQHQNATLPRYQYAYGGGGGRAYEDPSGYFYYQDLDGDGEEDLIVPTAMDESWGAPYDPDLEVVHWWALDPAAGNYGQKAAWLPPEEGDRIGSFFQTGQRWVNTLTVDRRGDRASMRLSYTNQLEQGIVPQSTLRRNKLSLKSKLLLFDRLRLQSYLAVNQQKGDGRMGTGYDQLNPVSAFRTFFQTNVGMRALEDYRRMDGGQATWNYVYYDELRPRYWDNPYWTRQQNRAGDVRNRILGYLDLSMPLSSFMGVAVRLAGESYGQALEERIASGGISGPGEEDIHYGLNRYQAHVSLNLHKQTRLLSMSSLLGAEFRQDFLRRSWELRVPGRQPSFADQGWNADVGSLMAQANLGLAGLWYLTAGLRLEGDQPLGARLEAESMPSEVYPLEELSKGLYTSLGSSFLFHRMEALQGLTFLDRLVLRANWGTTRYLRQEGDNFKGLRGLEWGLESAFLKERLHLSLHMYDARSVDRYTVLELDIGSGYTHQQLPGGPLVRNQGLEVQLLALPFRKGAFSWETGLILSRNRNEVLEVPDWFNFQQLESVWGLSVEVARGYPYGVLAGSDYTYTNGRVTVDREGIPLIDQSEPSALGSIQPDLLTGFSNTLMWKGMKLSFLLDMRLGGSFFSTSTMWGMHSGMLEETAGLNPRGYPQRDPLAAGGGATHSGAVYADGTPNTTYLDARRYWNFGNSPHSRHVYDASYVKLRELVLSYALPSRLFENNFMGSLHLALVGRNLWIIHKNVPGLDPEFSTSYTHQSGIEMGLYPSVRTLGIQLKASF